MKTKFQLGNSVKIQGEEWFNSLYKAEHGWRLSEEETDFFVDEAMIKYAGSVTCVTAVETNLGNGVPEISYHLEVDKGFWFWPEEALLPVGEEEDEDTWEPEDTLIGVSEPDKVWNSLIPKQKEDILNIKEVQEYLLRPKVGDHIFVSNKEALLRNRVDITYATVQGYDFLYGKVVTDKGGFTHYILVEDLDNPTAQIFKVPVK